MSHLWRYFPIPDVVQFLVSLTADVFFLVGSLAQFIVSLGAGVVFFLVMSVVPELSSFFSCISRSRCCLVSGIPDVVQCLVSLGAAVVQFLVSSNVLPFLLQ